MSVDPNLPVIGSDLIDELRYMVAEPDTGKYTDEQLSAIILKYPVTDTLGQEPLLNNFDVLGNVSMARPTITWSPVWIPSFDLNAAAAQIWDNKASDLAINNFDISADGQQFGLAERVRQAERRAAHYRALARPKAIRLKPRTGRERTALNYVVNGWDNDGL